MIKNTRSNMIILIIISLLWISCGQEIEANLVTLTDKEQFLGAAGNVTLESFETSSGSNIYSLTTPNFKITHTGGSGFSVLTEPSPYGTAATDGSRHLEEISGGSPNQFQFYNFQEPLKAFGLFIMDYGDYGNAPLQMIINNTSTFTIAETGHPDGNILYFGVVADGGDVITDVRLLSDDAIGLDEISLAASVPEPNIFFLFFCSIIYLFFKRK